MATATELLELIFSWIKQKEHCAEKLREFARELESLRKECNGGECAGSSVSVLGTACLLGACVATLFTGGAAAPFLGALGGAYTGAGLTISLATKLTEHFISSDTMKEAQKTEEKSNEIGETIQRLFHKLKAESSSTDPDEQDRHVMTEIVGAVARRSGLRQRINIRARGGGLGRARGFDPTYRSLSPDDTGDREEIIIIKSVNGLEQARAFDLTCKSLVMTAVAFVLICFSFKAKGKASKLLFAKVVEHLIKKVSSAGFKSFLKGGGMIMGGVGIVFALSEAIDNWKEMIKNNHVTEASQSLKDTADTILEMTRTLKKQLDNIKRILEEEEESDGEEEESDGEEEESDGEEEESDSEEEESDGEEEKSDSEEEESDGEEEESDGEEEESDSEEEESDGEEEESDGEEENVKKRKRMENLSRENGKKTKTNGRAFQRKRQKEQEKGGCHDQNQKK